MKKLAVFCLLLIARYLPAQELNYYLPDSVTYDPAIPKPRDIIYHEVGEWHVTHDRLVNYMKAVAAAAPARVKLETMGFTYEQRPQVLLIITSPRNHQRLEAIRLEHLQLADPAKSAALNIENMPVVVWIGHSIHGNESSGANASLLTAYYLAAAQGKQVDELLENAVILLDPSFNPDGLQRFSTWANQHKSKNLVSDPNSREFNEVWPGGRFNHYWFDLNRDWLPAVHVESQNRLRWYHRWKPNILTDHHEQGSNATFFFQPGVPSRVNPLTPARNQELTAQLGRFHAAYLDRIGSLYFTKENYDDFYYGKGSTYPDINGAIGVLFEQASSRGHLQETTNGLLSFPFTIKNQFTTALSTMEGAKLMRKEFLQWQRDFYKSAIGDAAAFPVKAYVFSAGGDRSRQQLFLEMLSRHEIQAFHLNKDLQADGFAYKRNRDLVVPLNQPQHRLIRAIFDRTFNYRDSLFYDITAWTLPLAYGFRLAELKDGVYKTELAGSVVTTALGNEPEVSRSEYGYIIPWSDFFAPAILNELQQQNLVVKVATMPFRIGDEPEDFGRGTLFVPVKLQSVSKEDIFNRIKTLAGKYKAPVLAVKTGLSGNGVDLGSSKFVVTRKPSLAMITGAGVNAVDAGEVWHLLDQRMNIRTSHLEPAVFNRVDLNKYNTLVLVGGNYSELNKEKLKTWVQNGGVLILTEEAVSWASQNGINVVTLKKSKAPVDSLLRLRYTDREQVDGSQQVSGAIFEAQLDNTHPLAFGYTQPALSLFKANKVFMEKSRNPYATPFYYGNNPLQSGWISRENLEAIKHSAAVVVNTIGSGRVINIADNPNFRAFWLGGSRLFMNAIFFGHMIDAASGRVD